MALVGRAAGGHAGHDDRVVLIGSSFDIKTKAASRVGPHLDNDQGVLSDGRVRLKTEGEPASNPR